MNNSNISSETRKMLRPQTESEMETSSTVSLQPQPQPTLSLTPQPQPKKLMLLGGIRYLLPPSPKGGEK